MNAYLKSFLKFGLPSLIITVSLCVFLLGFDETFIFSLIFGIIFCMFVTAVAGFLTSSFSSPPVADLGKGFRKVKWGQLGATLFSFVLLFGGAVISFKAKRVILGYAITLPVALVYVFIISTIIEIKSNVENTWSGRLLQTCTLIFTFSVLFAFAVLWLVGFDGEIIREIL